MQTQREVSNDSKISTDQVIVFLIFAACCLVSFFAEPTVVDTIFSVNP